MVLAVLLAICETSAPAPGQTADHSAKSASSVNSNAKGNQTPPGQSSSGAQAVKAKPQGDASQDKTSGDKPQAVVVRELPSVSVSKDWADWGYWGFGGLLVIVGAFQAWLIKRQADLMERQAGLMEEQIQDARTSSSDSAKIAAGTLAEIEKQAVLMERQTTVMEGQVKAVEDSAAASLASARAAQSSADSLMQVERAWLVFHLQTTARSPLVAEFTITNYGRTPAWITDLVYDYRKYHQPIDGPMEINAPHMLTWQNGSMIPPGTASKEFLTRLNGTMLLTDQEERKVIEGNLFLVFFAVVKYDDIFGEKRETHICQSFRSDYGWVMHGPTWANRRT